jgi:hypothetical protein
MTHRKGAVWTERLVLALILASLGGTLNLVLAIHRRINTTAIASKSHNAPPSSAESKTSPVGQQVPPSSAPPKTEPPPVSLAPPMPPPEDPTVAIVARIDLATAREADAAGAADRRATSLEAARQKSIAESQRWKRREMLVRQQVARLTQQADKIEQDTLTLDAERDVLARERDELKAAMVKASQRSGYAVLPYKGPNGTWRRPIVLECSNNKVKLQPRGPTFSMLDLSPLIPIRSSPIILAIAREMLHIQQSETPDGAPAVPYLVFLIRPDGIRSYYQARGRLEPLGIAFGYELIEQDLAVDIPDFDDVRTWDGSIPLDPPAIARENTKPLGNWPASTDSPNAQAQGDASAPSTSPGGDRPATNVASGTGTWPPAGDSQGQPSAGGRSPLARGIGQPTGTEAGSGSSGRGTGGARSPEIDFGGNPSRGGQAGGRQSGGTGDGSPDDFVWPTGSGNSASAGGGGSGPALASSSADGAGMGNGFIGTASGGMSGGGTSPTSGSSLISGGGAGPGLSGGGSFLPGGVSGGGAQGGPASGNLGGGSLAARASGAGSGDGPSAGAGLGPGGMSSGRGSGTGSDMASPGPLPNLESAQAGGSRPVASMAGGSPATVGSQGTGFGRSGSSGPATGGSAPSATAGSLAGSAASGADPSANPPTSLSGPTGTGTMSPGQSGSNGPDLGFSPYASGGAAPAGGGLGAASSTAGGKSSTDGTSASAAAGSTTMINPGQAAGSNGSQSGTGPLSGSTGSYQATSSTNQAGSSSATVSGLGISGSNSTAESNSTIGSNSTSSTNSTAGTNLSFGSAPASGSNTGSGSASSADNSLGTPPPLSGGGSPPSSSIFPSTSGSGSTSSTTDSYWSSSGGATSSTSADSSSSLNSAIDSLSAPSSSASSGSSGDQPPSAVSAFASGMSLPSLNMSPDPNSEPDALKDLLRPPIDTHRQPGAIDVPFEIVVVCRRDDLLLHPGGYRITTQALRANSGKGTKTEALLQRELRTMVRRRAQVDPMIRPKPRLKFLVETGGSNTFWTARQQLIFSNLDWPMSVQVTGAQPGVPLDGRVRP